MAEVRLRRMTATELLACCEAAHLRAELRTGSESSSLLWEPPYIFSNPTQMTDEEMKEMEGLYVSFLSNVGLWHQLLDVIRNKGPDGAAAALYFLNLPTLVFHVRQDTSGLHPDKVQDKFPLKTVLKRTTTNEELICLCRSLLGDTAAHDRVVESAVGLLYGALMIGGASKANKRGEFLLGGEGEDAVERFFVALSRVVARPGLAPATVVDSLHVLSGVLAAWESSFHHHKLTSHAGALSFRLALDRIKPKLPVELYVQLRFLVTSTAEMAEITQANGQEEYFAERFRSAIGLNQRGQRGEATESLSATLRADSRASVRAGSVNTCAAEGCRAGGPFKRCSKCKLVSYCGPGCQAAHWRAHKRDCKAHSSASAGASDATPTGASPTDVAALAARYSEGPSASTLRLRRALAERLTENPALDFVLTSRQDRDVAVQFDKTEMKVMFKVMKARAEGSAGGSVVSDGDRRKALSFMHMLLSDVVQKQGAGISLRQLQTELEALYGPYDPEAPWQGADATPVTPQEMAQAVGGGV